MTGDTRQVSCCTGGQNIPSPILRSNSTTILLIVSLPHPTALIIKRSAVLLHLFVTTYNQPNPTIDRVKSKLNS